MYALTTLGRNLAAGARLALFRPVSVTSFRITLGAALALLAFELALGIVLDVLRVGPAGEFNLHAFPSAVLSMGVSLLLIALVAALLRQPALVLALLVTATAAGPLIELAGELYRTAVERIGLRWSRTAYFATWALWFALAAWGVAVLARALALTLSPRPRHFRAAVAVGTLAIFGGTLAVEMRFPRWDWWTVPPPAQSDAQAAPSILTEAALVRQPQLLAESLASLEPQTPGVVDLYFVGFAPYAAQDVFLKDVRAARTALAERFGARGRGVDLVNNPRTVFDLPLATGSNLRATLNAIGQRIDRDEDIVLLFLTSHGTRDHRLSVEFAPLRLEDLSPTTVKSLLDEAGIRWRIVVVSACYSGGFVPALADARTLVMTAAAADRMSFGCSHDSEMTFFTEALFDQALRRHRSLVDAFEEARGTVAARERAEGLSPPSDPQIAVGAAIRDKLAALEARALAACAAANC